MIRAKEKYYNKSCEIYTHTHTNLFHAFQKQAHLLEATTIIP